MIMNEKQKAKWEKTRAEGKWRFVLLHGVVSFGVTMIVCTGLMKQLLAYFHITSSGSLEYFWQDLLTIYVPIFLVGGLLMGVSFWRESENNYRAALEKES